VTCSACAFVRIACMWSAQYARWEGRGRTAGEGGEGSGKGRYRETTGADRRCRCRTRSRQCSCAAMRVHSPIARCCMRARPGAAVRLPACRCMALCAQVCVRTPQASKRWIGTRPEDSKRTPTTSSAQLSEAQLSTHARTHACVTVAPSPPPRCAHSPCHDGHCRPLISSLPRKCTSHARKPCLGCMKGLARGPGSFPRARG
jgi:hypothetical protein